MTTLSPSPALARPQPAATQATTIDREPSLARVDRVAFIAALGVLVLMGVMLFRVAQLQIAPSPELVAFQSERQTKIKEEYPEGDLRDRRGIILATSRFGERVFIDPLEFPNPPGAAIALLADTLGVPAPELAKRIAPAMQDNQEILDVRNEDDPPAETAHIKRYLPVSKVLEDWRLDAVRGLKLNGKPIPGIHLERRPVREYTAAATAANVVGWKTEFMVPQSGAEKRFAPLLTPQNGYLKFVRDAHGEPMWIFPGGYTPPERGQDIRLALDLTIQTIVMEELKRGVEDADAAGGRCVVLDPYSGEILAMADVVRDCKDTKDYDWANPIPKGGNGTRYRIIPKDPQARINPALARNRCVEDVYEPGSTFKPFMWSACLMHGVTRPEEVFNTYNGEWHTPYGRQVKDVHAFATLTWSNVLVQSSNIGMSQGVARLTFQQARDEIVALGFGRKPNLGLPGESPGLVTSEKGWSKYTQTSVSFGYEVGVTPVQMARAFSAYCRTGDLAGTIPQLRLTALEGENAIDPGMRVMPAKIANLTRETMRGVTNMLDGRLAKQTGDKKEVFRYEAFGKSGTAQAPLGKAPDGKRRPKGSDGYFGGQYNVSFIAGAPFEDPKLVVLVVVDDPGPDLVKNKRYFGALVAGPINRRITERALFYMGVKPTVEWGKSVADEEEQSEHH